MHSQVTRIRTREFLTSKFHTQIRVGIDSSKIQIHESSTREVTSTCHGSIELQVSMGICEYSQVINEFCTYLLNGNNIGSLNNVTLSVTVTPHHNNNNNDGCPSTTAMTRMTTQGASTVR